jgi:hypothetical protein
VSPLTGCANTAAPDWWYVAFVPLAIFWFPAKANPSFHPLTALVPVFLIVKLSLNVLPESAVFVAVTAQAVDKLPDTPNFNTVIEYAGSVRALVLTPLNVVSFFVLAANCSADVTLEGANPLYAKLTGSDAEAL